MNLWLIKHLPPNPVHLIKYWGQYKYYIRDMFSNKQEWQCYYYNEEKLYDDLTLNDFRRGDLMYILGKLGVIREYRREEIVLDYRNYFLYHR